MKLAVNKDFMVSSFDLGGCVSFDGAAGPVDRRLCSTGLSRDTLQKCEGREGQMKYIATMALMLNLGVASVYAQHYPVKMVFSGTSAPSTVNLQQPNTANSEDNYAGNGTLGSFTYRDVRAVTTTPQPSTTCSGPNKIAGSAFVGAAVFRFQDGSLLNVSLTEETDCIDLAAGHAHCVLNFQITGGTGRFKDAAGTLTLTETVVPVLADVLHNPVFFAATGEITGTIYGVAREAGHQEDSQ